MTAKNASVHQDISAQDIRQAPASGEPTGLQYRYGRIGIEAVAAAVRYSNLGRKAEPQTAPRIDQRFLESGV